MGIEHDIVAIYAHLGALQQQIDKLKQSAGPQNQALAKPEAGEKVERTCTTCLHLGKSFAACCACEKSNYITYKMWEPKRVAKKSDDMPINDYELSFWLGYAYGFGKHKLRNGQIVEILLQTWAVMPRQEIEAVE